ncbi:MAG TPA: glycosyltransferase 87 family protein [Candidatus Solibacter sp.]|nr:glycosyltransferase 87 family protein [Candidatus Solibacter sp.]
MTRISWRPGWLTLACLAVAMIFPIWLGGLSAQVFRGADAKVYYAAAVLDAQGGNPNDSAALIEEGEILFNRPSGLHRGQPGAYYMAPYGFPRLFTRLSRPFIGLGVTGYYIAVLAAITIGSLLALEALMTALDWDRDRWLPRLFLVLSAPFAEDAFVGNVSAALFLSWAVAFLLARRGRPLLGGLVLSVCLIKAPVGVPAAAALVAFPPPLAGSTQPATWSRVRLAAGVVIGAAGWVALNVVSAGWDATVSWWSSMVGYGQALGVGPGGAYNLVDQAGLPSLLLGHVPALAAIALASVPVGCVMAVVLLRSRRDHLPSSAGATTALALSGALLLSPYLHLNDLLLEALPVLVIATSPLSALARFTLIVWAVGTSVNLVVALIEADILQAPRQGGAAGFGLVLAILAFAGVAGALGRRSRLVAATAP